MAGIDPYRFNENDKHADISLSNNDMTAAHTGSSNINRMVRSVGSKNSGKWYFEIHIDQRTLNSFTIGWADATHSLSERVGEDGSNIGVGWHTGTGRIYHDGSYSAYSGTAVQDDYVMVAGDLDAGEFWFGVNGSWLSSGDPANGTNPSFTESEVVGVTMYPAVTLYDNNDHICTIRTAESDFEGTVPSGFSALSGDGSIEDGISEGIGFADDVSGYLFGYGSIADGVGLAGMAGAEAEYHRSISGSVGLDDSAGVFGMPGSGPDGVGLSGSVGFNIEKQAGQASGVGLAGSVGVSREWTRGISEGVGLDDTSGASNFSRWLAQNADRAIYRYSARITGSADGLSDFELPGLKSFQIRMRSETPSYLGLSLAYSTQSAEAIAARQNGDLVVDMIAVIDGVESLREQLIRTAFDSLRYDRGGSSQSITLTGYQTLAGAGGMTALQGVTTESMLADGRMQFRCAQPDFYIKPGDIAKYGDDQITVGSVMCMVSPVTQYMDVAEA